jgi:hypothetical protein
MSTSSDEDEDEDEDEDDGFAPHDESLQEAIGAAGPDSPFPRRRQHCTIRFLTTPYQFFKQFFPDLNSVVQSEAILFQNHRSLCLDL